MTTTKKRVYQKIQSFQRKKVLSILHIWVVTDATKMHNWKQRQCAAQLKMNVVVHNYTEHDRGGETQIKAGRELPGLCRRLKPTPFATVEKKKKGGEKKKKSPLLPSSSELQSIPMLKANFNLQLHFASQPKPQGKK